MTPRREDAATAEMQLLWEETPQTAVQIALQFGITKNALLGMAHRRGWASFTAAHEPPPPETVFDRMDRLEARMNEVLAETRDVGHITVEVSKPARKLESQRDFKRQAGLFNA